MRKLSEHENNTLKKLRLRADKDGFVKRRDLEGLDIYAIHRLTLEGLVYSYESNSPKIHLVDSMEKAEELKELNRQYMTHELVR